MITEELKDVALSKFTKTYKQLLKSHIYKNNSQIRELFSGKEVNLAYKNLVRGYFDCLTEFYQKNPGAEYMDELEYVMKNNQIKSLVGNYVSKKNDKTLFRFLKIYSYCVQEMSRYIYDSNYKVRKDVVEKHFDEIARISLEMFTRVERDVKEGNYWWLKNSATTLRRQLVDNFGFVDTPRFKAMCEKYLERPMTINDIKKEFTHAINGGQKLVEELDYKMEKSHNAKPYYCWWEKMEDGRRKIHMSEEPPEKGVYSYIAYHDRIENRVVDKDNYFM